MTEQELEQILTMIKSQPVGGDEQSKLLLKLAADSISLEKLKALTDTEQENHSPAKPKKFKKKEEPKEVGIIQFSKKELESMPKEFKDIFITQNRVVHYRRIEGLYQARYRRDGFYIEVASKDYETMKRKFIERLTGKVETPTPTVTRCPLFADYSKEWLKLKQQTTKPSTYKEYARMNNVSLQPVFGKYRLSDISRKMVQDFLFGYVNKGKMRMAEKLKLQLTCIFDMASEDYKIESPLKKIVLPHHESKKGSAFTKEEEKTLVEFCTSHTDNAASSAILVLLYFGLRQSELKTLRILDGNTLECKTSKELLGKNVVKRRIPFTPVFQKVLPYVDFDKARDTNVNTISTTLKRLFPNHHPHELRYTFITRCKECSVAYEVVILWDGPESDKDVKSSRIDRGYTDYSQEYILAEAKKVDYTL